MAASRAAGSPIVALLVVMLASLGAAKPLEAQITVPSAAVNAAFLEVGGPGGFYSLNVDRLLNANVSIRAGATSWSVTSFDRQGEKLTAGIVAATVRADVSRFVDRAEGRYVEAGAAISFGSHSRSSYDTIVADGAFVTLVPMLGLRSQPRNGGFMYRATFTPFVPLSGGTAQYPKEGVRRGASLSAGYAF